MEGDDATENPDINIRCSSHIRKRPVKFREISEHDSDTDDIYSPSDSSMYHKVNLILGQRTTNGKTGYIVHFKGEPAHNAMWLSFDQLNDQAKETVFKYPPKTING